MLFLLQVWLRDGQKGTEVAFFKDKPLGTMAQMGQKVTLSARSIVNTSGADLKPSVLELQAISVVLNLEDFPDSVPRPTRYHSTLAILKTTLKSASDLFSLQGGQSVSPPMFGRD